MAKIREYRRIDFGTDMIAEAVRLCIADLIRLEMPDAELEHVRMAEGEEDLPEEAVVVARWRRSGGQWRDCTMDAEELTAVLIGWCRLAGIPLPRSGEKALEPAADGVTLVIRHKGLARSGALH
ncbi:hypothetical protein KO353_10365 [Elioraea tepida]|jgi:hypothetical protein|uniref:Uncharacterized protein n=1 Tax=Elioraea tepida TaxID=2843330 RepID=A0A975U007_9PROT|nr:hypothetical protein [Elioraea tepida]QXM23714.1 hypothetical protein KO353_10365 [Elioraea tepida]